MLGVFKKKNDLPEYLSHYGMFRAPFSSAIEDDMYYADPIRQQRLDILLHLTQNTNELLVVIGEQGMGKTTFINQFLKNAAEHWKLCFIEGHKMMSEEQFLERVYMGFNIAHASVHKGTMLSNLRKRLENMLEDALPVILVVDDAHLFSTKVLTLILEIASIKNTKTGGSVRVVLASEPQIKIMLAEPALEDSHNLIVRKIDLPSFDETNTGEYLHHRLTQAGMIDEQFLTRATISKIFKYSDGIPGKINEAADKLLFDTTPIIRRNSSIQAKQQSPDLKLFIISLIIALIIGSVLYFYTSQSDGDSTVSSNTQTGETTTPLRLPPAENNSDSTDKQDSSSKTEEPIDPMQLLKEELAGKTEPDQQGIPADRENENRIEPQGTIPKVTLPQIKQSEEASKIQANQQTNSAPVIQQVKPDNPDLKDNSWVLKQNPDHYTVQLVAGRQKQTITNFITKYKLSGTLIYFSSKRNGNVWHNLTYGIYPDRKSVNQAIKKLPASLANVEPWVRQIKSIQSEIRKLAQP
ncbi:AAA family ATPase [Kaarinaea lacus]